MKLLSTCIAGALLLATLSAAHAEKITFTSDRRHNLQYDIYLMNEDGSEQQLLIDTGNDDRESAISPDGSKVAFASFTSNEAAYDIYVINIDGSGLQRLTSHAGAESHPSWSPDGSKLTFARRDGGIDGMGGQDIFVMNADGSAQARLAHIADDYYPVWSPNGNKIAFKAVGGNVGSAGRIYIVNPDGSDLHSIGDPNLSYNTAAWSADGTRIVSEVYTGSGWDIYVMDADGSNSQRLTSNGHSTSPYFERNGDILFSFFAGDNYDIYRINADGSGTTQLTTSPSIDTFPNVRLITVLHVNTAPVANPDTLTVEQGAGSTVVDVLGNDTDEDEDILAVSAVTQPSHGTATLSNGVVRYMPDAIFLGIDSFTYTVSDGQGGTDTATVTVTVQAPSSTPSAKISGSGNLAVHGNITSSAATSAPVTFDLSASSNRRSVRGRLRIREDRPGVLRIIEATQLTTLVVNGKSARLYGIATVNGVAAYNFMLEVTDVAKKGAGTETLTLQLSNGYRISGPLLKGNITVQQK